MVLAAGLGTRMRAADENRPKPLVELCGMPLIDWVLDRVRRAGIQNVVVNTHYKADQIQAHLAGRPGIRISHEDALLETGGGVRKALPLLGDGPFLVVNSDAIWLDGPQPALNRLIAAWRPDAMDLLLMLQPMAWVTGYQGPGDYFLDPLGRARCRTELEVAPYLFAGAHITTAAAFEGTPKGPFSLNEIFDQVEAAERLYGMAHDGEWYHVGSPDQLRRAEDEILRGHTAVASR